jgi:hypothetical protein
MPTTAIGDAERAGFLTIDDLVEVHRGWEDVDQDFATDGRHDPGSDLGPASKLEGGRIDGEHMAHHSQETLGVGFNGAHEMTMGFELEMPALDQVDLLAGGHDRGLHGGQRTRTVVSTGIRIRGLGPDCVIQPLASPTRGAGVPQSRRPTA